MDEKKKRREEIVVLDGDRLKFKTSEPETKIRAIEKIAQETIQRCGVRSDSPAPEKIFELKRTLFVMSSDLFELKEIKKKIEAERDSAIDKVKGMIQKLEDV